MPSPGFGPQKIEMNKRTGSATPGPEYEAMLNSMLREQAYLGSGQQLEDSRSQKYGNVNHPGTWQTMQGDMAAGVEDSFNNAPLGKPTAQTAQLGYFSATQDPQKQPELMGQEAEEGIRQRMLGEYGGLNNRQQVYRA